MAGNSSGSTTFRKRSHRGQQLERLEDEAHHAPASAASILIRGEDVVAVDALLTIVAVSRPASKPSRKSIYRTRDPDDRDRFTRANVETYVAQDGQPRATVGNGFAKRRRE